jgi:hypothetical protein
MLKEKENQSEIATAHINPAREASQLTARHYKECTRNGA